MHVYVTACVVSDTVLSRSGTIMQGPRPCRRPDARPTDARTQISATTAFRTRSGEVGLTADTPLAGLDVEAVSTWLASAAGVRPPIGFTRIGAGQSNLTFLATDSRGRQLVLRRPPVGHLLASAHDIGREHRILVALQDTAVPTPRVVAYTESPLVTDAPLLAMQHIEGLVVADRVTAKRLDPAARRRLGHELARTLASIHAVDLQTTGLIDLASHRPYAARQLKRWQRQWEDSQTRELPEIVELAERLEAAMPDQHELTLVHGDFHLLNVVAAPDGAGIRAVLDWELSTLGDPLADLGGLLAYWPETGDHATASPVPALPGFPSRAEIAATYAEASGRDIHETLGFWHALGLWKVAVIIEGVRRRALDDPRNASAVGVPPQMLVDGLVREARRVALAAGI